MLMRLARGDLGEEIQENRGMLVFLWMVEQKYRLRGSAGIMSWFKTRPFLKLSRKGHLLYGGSILQQEPLTVGWLELLANLGILRLFHVNTGQLTAHKIDYDLICAIFKQSKEMYLKQFPGSKFVVLNYPIPDSRDRGMRQCFAKNDIEYVDLHKVVQFNNPSDFFPDRHPRPHCHSEIAGAFAKYLRKHGILAGLR